MNFDQEKTGEGLATLPVNEIRPLKGLVTSLAGTSGKGFDSLLGAGTASACAQYKCGGTMPIAAPAACVSSVRGEAPL